MLELLFSFPQKTRTFSLYEVIVCFFFLQNGVTSSIKPQQITYVVPGVENFDHTEISSFLQKVHDNLVGCSYLILYGDEKKHIVLK